MRNIQCEWAARGPKVKVIVSKLGETAEKGREYDFIIDTGFEGFLAVTPRVIQEVVLPQIGVDGIRSALDGRQSTVHSLNLWCAGTPVPGATQAVVTGILGGDGLFGQKFLMKCVFEQNGPAKTCLFQIPEA